MIRYIYNRHPTAEHWCEFIGSYPFAVRHGNKGFRLTLHEESGNFPFWYKYHQEISASKF